MQSRVSEADWFNHAPTDLVYSRSSLIQQQCFISTELERTSSCHTARMNSPPKVMLTWHHTHTRVIMEFRIRGHKSINFSWMTV